MNKINVFVSHIEKFYITEKKLHWIQVIENTELFAHNGAVFSVKHKTKTYSFLYRKLLSELVRYVTVYLTLPPPLPLARVLSILSV